MTQKITFDNGAAYERGMGEWSKLVGTVFLDWLAPEPGQRWVDVGCGNGAFTELVVQRCAPADIRGIDPSSGQLEFARQRPGARGATFEIGDAHALPFATDSADLAVMALVIFFLDDPAAGLAEMRRVVRPGGLVAAYAWDIPARSFPLEPIQAELRAIGLTPMLPPNADIACAPALHAAWTEAGLTDLRQCEIPVTRSFVDFEDFWDAMLGTGSMRASLAQLDPADQQAIIARVRDKLPPGADGRVSYSASANAIVGRVPAEG